MESISNNNLKSIMNHFHDFDDDDAPQFLVDILNVELAFSTLICPFVSEVSMQLMNHESAPDDFFIPAFTSLDDYYEFFNPGEYMPRPCDFISLKKSMTEDVEGIMINPAADDFFISSEMLDDINAIEFPEMEFRDVEKSDFKELISSAENTNLSDEYSPDDFVDDYDPYKFKSFLEKLAASPLFVFLSTPHKVKESPDDNIYLTGDLKAPGFYTIVNNSGNNSFLAFDCESAARKEHSHKSEDHNFFIMPTSFTYLVGNVLDMDGDGIIINHSTKPIFIPRIVLVLELENIISYSQNPDMETFSKYSVRIK